MDTQNDQHRSPKRSEIRFVSFWCDLEDPKFRRFLRKEKVDQTSDTNQKFEVLEQNHKGRQKVWIGLRLWSLSVPEFRFGTLRPPRGGGGSMGRRLFRRPQISFLFVIVIGV